MFSGKILLFGGKKEDMEKSDLRVSFVSTYPPRQCGIGTYTLALARAMDQFFLKRKTKVIAISNKKYKYSPRVMFEISQQDRDSYKAAAEFLNATPCEVVNIQHEYGIFGGEHGEYILYFLENLRKPRVVTLHSVLRVHPVKRKGITQRILDLSDRITVMTHGSKQNLIDIFHVDPGKIHVIHHGVPNVRPDENGKAKKKLGLEGKFVLTTFGLINPGKGIEYAIGALPQILKEVPNVLYLVIGKTHPVVRENFGEVYRDTLEQEVRDLKLNGHVKFIDRYLDYHELVDYLKATDIYLAPQIDPNQSASGTVAYAIGAGCAVVATPTAYSQEVLANGRGYLVNFMDSEDIAKKVTLLYKYPELHDRKRLKVYLYGRRMIWPVVGLEHLKVFEQLAYGKPRRLRLPVEALTKTPEPVLS